jgi:hypothetical protein
LLNFITDRMEKQHLHENGYLWDMKSST